MSQSQLPELHSYLEEWSDDLELLRQNKLLDERAFIGFSKDRGLAVRGVTRRDPADFQARGWLTCDSRGHDGRPLFHPFRVFPLLRIGETYRHILAVSASTDLESAHAYLKQTIARLQNLQRVEEAARAADRVADLAILLEPLYWPRITGRRSLSVFVNESDYLVRLDEYRGKVLQLVATLDVEQWRSEHESLRIKAAQLDDNGGLYLLLRLATWSRREKLKGSVSGALWVRHMAEVIRRAFEEALQVQWPEEDQAFGWSPPGARKAVYGSERLLDDELQSGPYLAFEFGLFTGSAVRWYVEGDTECYAIRHVMPKPSRLGIELVNLRGSIGSGRSNAALKLHDWLLEDMALRRFSMISFDMDVPENVRVVRQQLKEHNVVGFIAAHAPDFEFANFTIKELAEVAARIDEKDGVSGDAVRTADWTDVQSGRAFEKRYRQVSARQPRGLKGREWGEALATYAGEHPSRWDDATERPFWRALRTALQGRFSHYDYTKEHVTFDPLTFAPIDQQASGPQKGGAGAEAGSESGPVAVSSG